MRNSVELLELKESGNWDSFSPALASLMKALKL
ncbi:MAG: hypothetical protein CM1200mP3_15050 [Chloroflexota bacterium]|nr:MAG: hypothetical protein CM1200mP3_15050 [Chloroflexota bacterium]